MGLSDRDYIKNYSLGDKDNSLRKLLFINLILYVTLALCKSYFYFIYQDEAQINQVFKEDILSWFGLPASLKTIAFRPWTIVTMLFTEIGFWTTVGNMIWFWAFGYIFQDLTGNKKIIPLYVYAGLAGGLVFVVLSQIVKDQNSIAYAGTTAAVAGVVTATVTLTPNYKIYSLLPNGFPLWILGAIYGIMMVLSFSWQHPLSNLPIVAGAAMGYIFVWQLKKGKDLSKPFNYLWEKCSNIF